MKENKKWHLWTHRARNPDPCFAEVGIQLKGKTNTSSTKAQNTNQPMTLFVPRE